MLSNTFAPALARRRGIVLILVLATLALMAVIGVTFATFTGQGKIGARNFAQSVLAPRPDDPLVSTQNSRSANCFREKRYVLIRPK